MTRTERLQPVVKHTENKEKKALEALAFSQGELELEKSRLGQLKSYKKEYFQSYTQQNSVYSAIELQELIDFWPSWIGALNSKLKSSNYARKNSIISESPGRLCIWNQR